MTSHAHEPPFAPPFRGAVSAFFEGGFPEELRHEIEQAAAADLLDPAYPYDERMKHKDYDDAFDALQIEIAKLQAWVKATGERVAIVFEGRDAAGKGGTIARWRRNLNPRGARIVALPKPTEAEAGQWYFQRYVAHLPTSGEIVFFDRSWYNRAVVERVFGFSSDAERHLFFQQVPAFERMLTGEGIRLFKIWLTVGRAEQMRRMLAREADPLKHWKLSRIDVEGLAKWDAYTEAIGEMFARTHGPDTPWTVILAEDKRRARLAAQRAVLSRIPYDWRDAHVAAAPDPKICGGPEILLA